MARHLGFALTIFEQNPISVACKTLVDHNNLETLYVLERHPKRTKPSGYAQLVWPRDPGALRQAMKDEHFAQAQRRRAQAEAQVAIFKK